MNDQSLLDQLANVLRALDPNLDAIVCYASTMDEHEPNQLAYNARQALAAYDARGAQGEVDEDAAFDLLRILLTSARNSRPLAPMLNEWLARARIGGKHD